MRVSGIRRGGSGKRKRSRLNMLARGVLFAIAGFYSLIALSLIALKWVDPPTTAVQAERRLQSWIHRSSYRKVYAFVPLAHISPTLQHAAVAAEDARFFQHHGFDWKEVRIAVKSDLNEGKSRGASTITQQLVKNLFLGTSRSFLRKGIEFTIVPLAEFILSKNRILELYLNVIERGPGVYGGEAAAQHYFRIPARQLTREEAVELASILPAPLHRKPGRLTEYEHVISERMAQMGW